MLEQPREFKYLYCPLNVKGIKKLLNLMAFRTLRFGAYTFAEYLDFQQSRVVPKEQLPEALKGKKCSWTLDRYALARVPTELGLDASWEGSPDVSLTDTKLDHERAVPGALRGLTTFAGPKVLRYLCRSGLDLVAVDVVNSHPVHILKQMSGEEREKFPELVQYALDRPKCFSLLMQQMGGKRVDAAVLKQLVLAIIYGGGLRKQLEATGYFGVVPAWLQRLQVCVAGRADSLAKELPEVLQKLEQLERDQPKISLLSYHSLAAQARTVTSMAAAVSHGSISGYERDCIVLTDHRDVQKVREQAGVPTSVEAYPSQDFVMQLLALKHPLMDFAEESMFDWKEFRDARACCLRKLQPVVDKEGNKSYKTPDNTTDFGLVMSVRLEPYVFVGTGKCMEFYDQSQRYGKWKSVEQRDVFMKQLVRRGLLNEFRETGIKYEVGGKATSFYKGPSPPPCKRKPFWMSITDEVSTSLQRSQPSLWLNGEHTRGWLMDKMGVLYNYELDKFVVNTPSMRMSKNMPWAFHPTGDFTIPDAVWAVDSSFKSELEGLLMKVFDFWKGGGKSLEEVEDNVFGLPLGQALKKLVASQKCQVFNLLMPMFDFNLDETLWFLLHATADIVGWKRRCEFRYLWGAGNSGKDTWAMVMEFFMGHRDTNGTMVAFPKTYFTGFKKRETLDPTLDTGKHMNLIICNEVPQHAYFCAEDTKDLCEALLLKLLWALVFSGSLKCFCSILTGLGCGDQLPHHLRRAREVEATRWTLDDQQPHHRAEQDPGRGHGAAEEDQRPQTSSPLHCRRRQGRERPGREGQAER